MRFETTQIWETNGRYFARENNKTRRISQNDYMSFNAQREAWVRGDDETLRDIHLHGY